MKNHNNIKKHNLLLLCYFPFLKMRRTYAIYILEISSEILKRTHEKKRVSQFRRKSDVSRFWWSDQRTNKSIELKNRNLKTSYISLSTRVFLPLTKSRRGFDASCSIGDAEYRNQSHVWRAARKNPWKPRGTRSMVR